MVLLGPTSSGEQIPPVTEPVRPQSLPLSSGNRVISHTESRSRKSATPPSNLGIRQQTLNPPPPLIQVSSSRDKKYITTQDLAPETSRPREGLSHSEAYHDRYLNLGQETCAGRDVSRRTHTPVDNRGAEREKRSAVVETVDLTREREVSTASLIRPTAISPVVSQGSSSARATLQAMARYALAETSSAEVTEKMGQKRKEETYLPPRHPDVKLNSYEQNEAIRKYKLGTVCLPAPREFPVGGEYSSQPYALMAMQAHHQPLAHPHPAGTSTPPPYGYSFHIGHPVANLHHHPEHRFLVPVGVHQLPVRELLPHSVNGEDLPGHLKLSGAFAHQYSQGAGYYPGSLRSIVPTYQPMSVCGHPYPVPLPEERRTVQHPLDVPIRRHNEISEQDLANPFVVKQQRHMHAPGMPEQVVSPGDLPKFPLPSRSPKEAAVRPHALSPEMKPQIVAHAEEAKTVSPPTGTYLSRIPSRPASVSEMRNRAAVIPELTDTEGSVHKFPDPQPVVIMPSSKHSGGENIARHAEDEFIKETKERPKEEKAGSLAEAIPMSAFATLVDVAAAARKVDVPIEEESLQKETVDLQVSPTARQAGHTIVSHTEVTSPPSPSRTSPGVSSTPRYGITTGLVKKPPPLMPITGMRSLQEGSSSSSTPISVSITSHGNVLVSRSPSKLTSPPGTRSTRSSVSPDGPPPLISHTVISPTSGGATQGTSPKGPPPLIKGIVSPVPPALRSPERVDSTRKVTSNQDNVITLKRPDQEPSQSDRPFKKSMRNVDVDFQPNIGLHLHESPQASLQKTDDDNKGKNRSTLPHSAGQSQVRTIFETITYVGSVHAELRHASRHHMNPYQPPSAGAYRAEECSPLATSSSALFTETSQGEGACVGEMSRSWAPKETEKVKNVQPHPQLEQAFVPQDTAENVDQRDKQSWQGSPKHFPFHSSDEHISLPQHEPSAQASISNVSGSETEEGDEGDMETEDEVPPVHPRILALTRRGSQGHSQSPYYDPSDSETLSAEESETLPESSDEMFPSTTMKPCTQFVSSSEGDKGVEHGGISSDNTPDTGHTFPTATVSSPSTSRVYSDDENEKIEQSGIYCDNRQQSVTPQDIVTSTEPLSVQLPDVRTEDSTVDSPTTSSLLVEAGTNILSPHTGAEEEETEDSIGREFNKETDVVEDETCNPSQSSPPIVEGDPLEALPNQALSGLHKDDAVTVDSSEDVIVGSSETDKVTDLSQAESPDPQTFQDIPDSSANLENSPDRSETSPPNENIDNDDNNVVADGAFMVRDENSTTTVQLGLTVLGEVTSEVTDVQSISPSPLEKDEDNYVCPSTSETERNNVESTVLDQGSEEDEEISEADALEKPPAEHGFLIEPETYSSSSDSHHPEITSAVDCVSDDSERVSCPTFVGEFVPLPGEVDSPDIRSGCSTHIPSDEGSVCDEMPVDKEMKDAKQPSSPTTLEPSDALDEGAHQTDDTLSEGEIPPSQESSQSEDEVMSPGDKPVSSKAPSNLTSEPIKTPQSTWHLETTLQMADSDQGPSQSKETEDDDQLSEGEIRESEDEPTTEPTEESSSSNTYPVSSTVLGGAGDTVPDRVSLSEEATTQSDCYINMIPISPAPPESPSHQSKGDRTSPLPPWPSIESQYSSVVSLAARMTSKGTPFPYSSLSLNVGSASSSARSSPVPHSFTANLAPGSSPSTSSLLPRPQEPAPLLSDSYEPLSDDEDDELADTSNVRDEQHV